MPLTEVSINLAGRNANGVPRSEPLHKVNGQAADVGDRAKAAHVPDPSSIQTMLKNTTEIGDLGQLPINAFRKPPSAFKGLPEIRHGGSSVSRRHLRAPIGSCPYDENDAQHPSIASRRNFPTCSPSSGLLSQGSRSLRARPGGQDREDFRSWSMDQNSYVNHALANRHPYLNHGHQARSIGPAGRPRSPFAYPTRLKRPGYRPSSPALSDIHQSQYGIGVYSRPATPASMSSLKRSPTPWQQQVNRSDPMLRHHASTYGTGSLYQQSTSPTSSQPSTPRPTPSLRSVGSSSRLPRTQLSMNNMWTHHESPPAQPLFYDYSEEFEDVRRPTRANTPGTTPYEQLVLHTRENHAVDSNMVQQGVKPVQSLALGEKALITPAKPSIRAKTSTSLLARKSIHILASKSTEPVFSAPEANKRHTTGTFISAHKFKQLIDDGIARSSSTLKVATEQTNGETSSSRLERNFENTSSVRSSDRRKTDLGTAVNGQDSPSSSDGSMCTAESNSYLEDQRSENESASPNSSNRTPKRPAIESEEVDDASSQHERHMRRPTFGSHSVSDSTEMFSPTPERSVTSPNSCRRFSKILGLDDISIEKDETVKKLHHTDDLDIKNDVQSLSPVRDSLANNDTVNTSILQLSDSDDEHDFSPSLIQTFGGRPERRERKDSIAGDVAEIGKGNTSPPEVSTPFQASPTVPQENSNLFSSVSDPVFSAFDANESVIRTNKATKHRHAQIFTSQSRSILRVDKELPPVPEEQRSFVSISRPVAKDDTDLPFDFAPLTQRWIENESIADHETPSDALKEIEGHENDLRPPPVVSSGAACDRDSIASSHGSRPWNNESNYPWASQQPNLEVTLPQSAESTPPPTSRFPRFKLRVHRASTSTTGTGRLTKRRASSDGTSSSRRSSGFFPRPTPTYKLKSKPKLSISPGQVNSSHDIGNESLHTRFVESFGFPPQLNTVISSPTITLLPPSPGHEVRSFFSDDSSQAKHKGSLRKRLSDFRARHSQVNLSDEARGYDRGLLSSALGKSRASGRSSRQSQNTAGATSNISHIKRVRSSVFRKVRFWWNRNEERFRDWSYKIRSHQAKSRARNVDLYPGA